MNSLLNSYTKRTLPVKSATDTYTERSKLEEQMRLDASIALAVNNANGSGFNILFFILCTFLVNLNRCFYFNNLI